MSGCSKIVFLHEKKESYGNYARNHQVPDMTPQPSDAEVPDFIAATMSIFLAVSPSSSSAVTSPATTLAPKFHVCPARCRSLNQMDKVGLKTSDMSLNVPLQQRRYNLARSQVNSSEYFSVAFEVAGQDSGHEFLLASKGTTLAESLGTICGRRGIDLMNCEVLLEQYKTPLPILTTDTAWLGGKHITVKEKDPSENRSNKTFGIPSRKTSRSCKGRSSFFSSSTEDVISNSDSGALSVEGKPKLTKQRWSGLFGNSKDSKMELLVEKLNNYSKCGIPQVLNRHDEDLEESLYKLEDDWKEIVSKNIPTTETQRHQQTAIWELVQTEIAYIHTLKLVTDLFLACLVSLQKCNLLCDIDRRRLFSNIEEISLCNINLWAKYLLPMLAAARESCALLDPFFLLGAFLKCDELFAPYVLYCSEQSDCQKYCREKTQTNEMFTAYLAWCETQKDCQRLRLIEMLVKPMQRLTKYSLLLKAILKHTVDEKQRESLETMIERMDAFVNSVNNTLKYKEDMESLKSLIARIEGYDVLETKDEELEKIVRTHSVLDLKKPMPGCNTLQKRQLIAEADLKLKDSFNSKAEVRCILLTDMLLICKTTRGSHLKVIRPPYQVHRLLVQELTRETPTLALVYMSEYATPVAAFLLLSPDSKTMKNFLTSLRRAEGLYNAAKLASEDAWRVEPDSNSSAHASHQSPAYRVNVNKKQPEVNSCSANHDMTTPTFTIRLKKSVSAHKTIKFTVKGDLVKKKLTNLTCSHSGSVEMGCSPVSSRGLSVESEVRPISHSSDEALVQTDTLRVVVPQLGQSLPDLKEASRRWLAPPPRPLAPPPAPPRGASYPPPSPPLRRTPAIRHNTMDTDASNK